MIPNACTHIHAINAVNFETTQFYIPEKKLHKYITGFIENNIHKMIGSIQASLYRESTNAPQEKNIP
jgi:hypothetical protein